MIYSCGALPRFQCAQMAERLVRLVIRGSRLLSALWGSARDAEKRHRSHLRGAAGFGSREAAFLIFLTSSRAWKKSLPADCIPVFPKKAAAPGRSRSSLSCEQPRDAPSPFPPPQLCFFRLFPNKKQHHSCFPTSKELLSFRISSFNFAAGSGRCRCDGSTSLGSTLFGNFIPSSLPHSISLFPMAGVGAAGLYLIVNKVIAAPSQSKRVGIGLWIQHMGDGGACQGGKQHLILQGWPQHQSKAPTTPQSWFVRC